MRNEHKHQLKTVVDCISIIRGTVVDIMNYEDSYREHSDLTRDQHLRSAKRSRMLDDIQTDLYTIMCKIKEAYK